MSNPTVLVTGSAGHLGKALMLALPDLGYAPLGIDIKPSETTSVVGSITDVAFLADLFAAHPDIAHVIHAATLHKPHVDSHTKNDFVQTNIAGTLALLEAATASSSSSLSSPPGEDQRCQQQQQQQQQQRDLPRIKSFVYISTTSAFGTALSPPPGQPAAWITDDESRHGLLPQRHKNIYGLTKSAAEDLCRLVHEQTGLPVIVLRTSRFFPEEDDDEARRAAFVTSRSSAGGGGGGAGGGGGGGGDNLKVLELAYRRVDIADVVGACVCAMERAGHGEGRIGWGRYIVSAPTPFGVRNVGRTEKEMEEDDEGGEAAESGGIRKRDLLLRRLDRDAEAVFREAVPASGEVFDRVGWKFLKRVDRVYDSSRAVAELGWRPEYTFERAVEMVGKGEEWRSELAVRVGRLGYHDVPTGVYTTAEEG